MAIETTTVSRDEVRAELDAGTREQLNISAEEFIRAYRANELNLTTPSVARLAMLVRLIGEEAPCAPQVQTKRRFVHRFRTAPTH